MSAELIEGSVATGARGWRIPAAELEAVLARAIAAHLRDPQFASRVLLDHRWPEQQFAALLDQIAGTADQLDAPLTRGGIELLRALVLRAALSETELRAEISLAALATTTPEGIDAGAFAMLPPVLIVAPMQVQRRGHALHVVLQGAAAPSPKPDQHLVRALIEARARVLAYLKPEHSLTVSELADGEGADVADVSRSLQLAFLAPDLVESILDGSQPFALTAQRLRRLGALPLLWDEQRAEFA